MIIPICIKSGGTYTSIDLKMEEKKVLSAQTCGEAPFHCQVLLSRLLRCYYTRILFVVVYFVLCDLVYGGSPNRLLQSRHPDQNFPSIPYFYRLIHIPNSTRSGSRFPYFQRTSGRWYDKKSGKDKIGTCQGREKINVGNSCCQNERIFHFSLPDTGSFQQHSRLLKPLNPVSRS